MGVNIIASDLARGLDSPQGGALAEAVLIVGRAHLDDPACNPQRIAECMANSACSLAAAHQQAGRHDDIVLLSDEMDVLLAGRTDGNYLARLRLAAVDALIAMNRLEEAERALAALEGAGCSDPSLSFTRDRLAARLQNATELADNRSPDRAAQDQYRQGMIASAEALRAMVAADPDMAGLAAGFDALARQAQTEALPKSAWDVFDRASTQHKMLAGLLGLDNSALHVWKTRVREASRAFRDNDGRDPALLAPALQTFREAVDWFDGHDQREDGNNARWCAYIAERRLGRPGAALDVLDELAGRLERDRAGIADPLRRAGQAASFPMLPAAMVECADMIGQPTRMLAAIERAKGRALAELRAAAEGVAIDEAALQVDPATVASLVAELGIGYASYLAIDDAVFGVAVWPDGTWHRARIPLDTAKRVALCGRIQPKTWRVPGRSAAFDFGAELAPLVDWLVPLLPDLPPDGHLVLSPDGELHQWPLQMATTPEGPLGLVAGVTRVHGVDALRRLAASPPARPSRSVAVHIPARNEAELAAKKRAMTQSMAALPCPSAIPAKRADSAWFATLDAASAVLHLNAHGVFPEARISDGIDPNPYHSAGLLISHEGELPERSGAWKHRLTPSLVMEAPGLKVDGAIAILQGCVSGLAKEGLGGDALGLEWALLARGADTVLASHWDVDYRSAGAFCRHFNTAWLGRGRSRIAAWQEAAARTREDPEGGPAEDWAAFSLSGDWR
ncbi:CHAT domain-containing protein [Mycobacterium sp. KBS0706]|uniref:CHAT domain-containing protein n=1 Tax=Mycobacterium sp. KBS0706 TaxID=2578109 RepID=UPI00163D4219|nr:CHAT domain-containing protein [Mycobacterium sp. KBS0706]